MKITRLRLYPFDCMLKLAATKKTVVLFLVPDIVINRQMKNVEGKLDRVLSTPKCRKISRFCVETTEVSEPLWPVLCIELSRYAQSTENGIRFSLKSLLNISEKVHFMGIVIGIDIRQNYYGNECIVKIRDIVTNDTINVIILNSTRKQEEKEFIESIRKYFVLKISGYRMVLVI